MSPRSKRFSRGEAAALLAGLLLPLAFAPFGLFPLAILSPAWLFVLWRDIPARRAFWRGWLFGIGAFGLGVSWVFVAMHDFGATPVPLAVLLTFLFVAFLALYPALIGGLGRWLSVRFGLRPGVEAVLLFPLLWGVTEWLRGWLLTGFTWLNPGFSQTDGPLAGLVPVIGLYGTALICAFAAGLLAYGWICRQHLFTRVLPALAALGFVAIALGRVAWVTPVGEPLRVSLIQGNTPLLTKWDADQVQKRLELYRDLTMARVGEAELIVWPENALTFFYQDLDGWYLQPLAQVAAAGGSTVIGGMPVRRGDGGYYTSMVRLGNDAQYYHKRHLVPFGEYVPFERHLRGLIPLFNLPMSGFSAGEARQTPLRAAGHTISASVCYEDAFPDELLAEMEQAGLLVNGSNNAWYGDSLAPHQHLQISRFLALASGRPLLRATSNGISALIDHRGELLARSPQFETHILDGRIQPMRGLTPYVRWGNGAFYLLLAVMGLALAWFGYRNRLTMETVAGH